MQLFTTGKVLNPNVYKQNRIINGTQEGHVLSPFIFYPNYLATHQIFSILDKPHLNTNHLITGGYGISKTISIVLFLHLAQFINKFLIKS